MDKKTFWTHYFIYLVKWPLLACIIGAAVGGLVRLFNLSLDWIIIQTNSIWFFGLPILGGLITGLIGKWIPGVYGDGTQVYIDRVDRPPRHSLRLLLGKLAASLATLGTGGSGGRVAPFVLMGGAVGKLCTRLQIFPHSRDNRITTVCGAAAGVGALLGSPLGGGIFAAEVLFASSLDYNVLFPAILASMVGYLVNHLILGGMAFGCRLDYTFSVHHLPLILITIAFSALVGMIFVYIYEGIKLPVRSKKFPRWLYPVLGGIGVTIVGLIFGKRVMGTGEGLVLTALSNQNFIVGGILLLAGKLLATTMTVKSGGSGGLTFPAIIMGALAANIVSLIFGLGDSILHHAIICAGISAAMASVLNTPIAAVIIMLELFGVRAAPPIIMGAVLGFIIGRPKVIYSYRDSGVWKKSRGI
ncbi:MAG: chloride channel protein [Candidatus Auribacterota bacterium]|nr:chloride channel protein [Candidatus Auribacterota bacterium]